MKSYSKVAIIGAGFVGSTAAYSLLIDGVASEIALIDIKKEKAEGEALDLVNGTVFTPRTKITYGDSYSLCKDAEIVIITAGVNQKPGETRLDLIKKNAAVLKDMIPKIVKNNKNCILLLVTNPLDVITYLSLKYSGFPEHRVFGTGTILDTARFRQYLGEHFGVNPTSVQAYILGEHGDSEFPVWSSANIAGVSLKNFDGYNKKAMDLIFEKTKNSAYEIIAKKGATYYAIGLGITKIVRTILTDQREILPISCLVNDYYGVNDVCLSIPVILDRTGIKKKIMLLLDKEEKILLKKSAGTIKRSLSTVLA